MKDVFLFSSQRSFSIAIWMMFVAICAIGYMPGTVRAAVSATDLLSLTQTCNQVSNGKYPTDEGAADTVPVCKLNGGFFWKADADIDCDGASSAHCSKKTDPWFAPETSFTGSNGKYPQAEFVPWVVIPIQDDKDSTPSVFA
jgi:hypothetical protein